VGSTYTEADINALVFDGVLPDQATAGWRAAAGERFLTPDTDELVVFESFFVRGFRILAHPFLCKLLHYYVIALYHLNPNIILQIAIFINLCEAYLGIDAHFNLFRYFFCLKSFSGSGGTKVVGGVYLVLRDGMTSEYITVPLNSSMKGWNARWFYTKNWEPSISPEIDQLAVPNANWIARPSGEEMNQVKELLSILKKTKVDGVG